MANFEAERELETFGAYLELLRSSHPEYPDCCTFHVQKAIIEEHACAHVPAMLEAAR
jgi:hypothetical protein